VQLYL